MANLKNKNTIKKDQAPTVYSWNENGTLDVSFNLADITEQKSMNLVDGPTWVDSKLKILKSILENNENLVIFIQCDFLAHDDYLKIIKENNHLVVLALADTENQREARYRHPGKASNARIRKAYKKLKENGARVAKFKLKTLETMSFNTKNKYTFSGKKPFSVYKAA